ncbi:MAG: hypothetical protein GF398_00865 [Chitinivibrionales bacterium]|nr:hypothetical protein [Chitinivibrionales bacterium]
MKALLIAMSLLVPAWAANPAYAIPKEENVPLYPNEIRKVYEQPIDCVAQHDRLRILATGKTGYKVASPRGTVGWVRKELVAVVLGRTVLEFAPAEIEARYAELTPLAVLGTDWKDAEVIRLDRSFNEALRENTDREIIDRITAK